MNPRCLGARALTLIGLLSLSGCAISSGLIAHVDQTGWVHEDHPLRIDFQEGSRILVDSSWFIDNARRHSRNDQILSKVGPGFERRISLDATGDGQHESEATIRRYEVLLRHRRTDDRLALSVYPISQQNEETDLAVLAREAVDSLSGTGGHAVHYVDGTTTTIERRTTARIIELERITVDGFEAVGVTYEIADIDQLRLDDSSRLAVSRMILIRVPWRWTRASVGQYGGGESWPMLARVVYNARPESFERGTEAFARFVRSIRFLHDEAVLASQLDAIRSCFGDVGDGWVGVQLEIGRNGELNRVSSRDIGFSPTQCIGRVGLRFEATGHSRRVTFTIPRHGAWPAKPSKAAVPFGESWPRPADPVPAEPEHQAEREPEDQSPEAGAEEGGANAP
jgi:hypothetical protein